MSRVINLYTSAAPAAPGRRLAYELFFQLLPGIHLNVLPLSALPPAPRGPQPPQAEVAELRRLRQYKHDALSEVLRQLALARQEPHRYPQTIHVLGLDQVRLEQELAALDARLAAEAGEEPGP